MKATLGWTLMWATLWTPSWVRPRLALGKILAVTEAQTDRVIQYDQGCDGREIQRKQGPGLGSEKTSRRRRQMTWVLKDKKEQKRQSGKRKQRELGSRVMKEWQFRKDKRPSKPRVALGQEMELSGRQNPDFILKAIGSHRRMLSRRVMLSDSGFTQIPLGPIGRMTSRQENGVGRLLATARVWAGDGET